MAKQMLERAGYKVTAINSSLEALEMFRKNTQEFDLVITDQTMPKMTGFELAVRILEQRPELPIILCTGYSSIISEEQARAAGIKDFMLKPFTLSDISARIRLLLDGEQLSKK